MRAERYPQRVVVDTNVWISAALSPTGWPAQAVRRVLEGGVPVLSERTYAELETRLWRPKFDPYFPREVRGQLLRDLRAAAYWVEIAEDLAERSYCCDRDDDAFVHAAEAAQALWLITGDADLLAVVAPEGLRILTPAAFLELSGSL